MTALTTLDDLSDVRPLSYRTPDSCYRIVVTTPTASPRLWAQYLEGAQRSYGAHDVAGVLDLDVISDGRSTSLVFLAFGAGGRVVGGMRSQGPYSSADQAHAVAEWDRDPGQPLVRAMVEERLSYGVVESKSAWVDRELPDRRELVGCLARAPLHASMISGARFALGTSAAHTLPMWTSTGAVVAAEVAAVGYPSERYCTNVLWWDRWQLPATVAERQRRALDVETAQLLSPFVPAPRR